MTNVHVFTFIAQSWPPDPLRKQFLCNVGVFICFMFPGLLGSGLLQDFERDAGEIEDKHVVDILVEPTFGRAQCLRCFPNPAPLHLRTLFVLLWSPLPPAVSGGVSGLTFS